MLHDLCTHADKKADGVVFEDDLLLHGCRVSLDAKAVTLKHPVQGDVLASRPLEFLCDTPILALECYTQLQAVLSALQPNAGTDGERAAALVRARQLLAERQRNGLGCAATKTTQV